MRIAQCTEADLEQWTRLRHALWPDQKLAALREGAVRLLARREDNLALIARDTGGTAIGFAEVALRRDYVNGCETSPVVFLEGIYVEPAARRRGVARALIARIGAWGKAQGCTEFASDALLDNVSSHAMHKALGFEEAERVVYFRKVLG